MTDQEFVEDRRRALSESVEYFSAKNKIERELWVCVEFLKNLGVRFEDKEARPWSDEPPDVVFRDARFEIKEILDPGRRRHAEYKLDLEKAQAAKKPEDFLEPFTPLDITPLQIADRLRPELEKLALHYEPSARARMDLLFYVNLQDHFLLKGPMPGRAAFAAYGWRSISVLKGWGALVYYAAEDAPTFLRSSEGVLLQRNSLPE
ncbi:MAG: DUF1780 domain-containing protein [Elusimicrobiota bacterium]|nr:DUF1780 domain-containing protein [Elusimicrobiota bacterium]